MSEELDEVFLELQRGYLAEGPERLAEVREAAARYLAGEAEGAAALRIRFHRLSGSGGSYGFPEISSVARELERWIAGTPPADPERVGDAIARLEAAFRAAGEEIHQPAPARAGFSWDALCVMSATPLREEIERVLRSAGYTVRIASRHDEPGSAAAGALPDLLVVAAEAGEGDPSAVAAAWTAGAGRPGAVVLIETLRAVDRLRATAAGIDATFAAEVASRALPGYARTLAKVGPPPREVLLVEAEVERADAIALPLEEAGVRVVRSPQPQAVVDLLDREVPDLLLISGGSAELDPRAVSERVRGEQRFALLPILTIRAGADPASGESAAASEEVLDWPLDPSAFLQTVVAHAERGRRLRETRIRDPLTGLLNRGTLIAELEHEVEHRRRFGGSCALVCFDLPTLDALSQRAGADGRDRVLRHVATVVRSNVRASDLISRSEQEFGLVLRGVTPEGAAVVVEKLHRVIGAQPMPVASDERMAIPIRVGAATFPASGTKAAAVVQKAERQMQG